MIFMLGHSTRSWKEFVEILKTFGIEVLVDIRRFPSSKKFPWFCREFMERELEREGIEYLWLQELGGFRKGGYANHTRTEEYKRGVEKLLKISKERRVAVMCAELLWWRCHRRYVADTLARMGERVVHIWNKDKIEEHEFEKYIERRVWCDKKAKKLEKFLKNNP